MPARASFSPRWLEENPATLITDIGVGKQQLVEIAKALSKKVRLLILDEPTASLNETDSAALLKPADGIPQAGLTSIIISHKLNEIKTVADKITILRDGGTVETLDCHSEDISEDRIIKGMVRARHGGSLSSARAEDRRDAARGEELERLPPAPPRPPVPARYQLYRSRWRSGGHCRADGRRPHRDGNEPLRPLLGPQDHREVRMHGKPVDVSTIERAIDAGLAYVHRGPEASGSRAQQQHHAQHHALQPAEGRQWRRHRRHKERKGRAGLSQAPAHPLALDLPGNRQSFPAATSRRSCCRSAVHRSRGPHPRRADARHRCRREI